MVIFREAIGGDCFFSRAGIDSVSVSRRGFLFLFKLGDYIGYSVGREVIVVLIV